MNSRKPVSGDTLGSSLVAIGHLQQRLGHGLEAQRLGNLLHQAEAYYRRHEAPAEMAALS